MRTMMCLVSNEARSLWFCLKLVPAEGAQPRAPSSLNFFPGSREYEYVSSAVAYMGSPHMSTGVFIDSKTRT